MSAKSTKEFLLDMGFTPDKIDKAVTACGDNVEQAMEWLLSHAGDDDSSKELSESRNASPQAKAPEEGAADEGSHTEGASADEPMVEIKAYYPASTSIKCNKCGKLFKSNVEVEIHVMDSEHSSFTEIADEERQLSEEEKRQKLRDFESKLERKEERKEVIEREEKRIKISREIADTRRRIQDEEMRRVTMERKSQKMEDKISLETVKEQIAMDIRARKEMFGGCGSATSQTKPPETSVITTAASSVNSVPAQKKEYDTIILEIRLPSGAPLMKEFKAKESLSAVRLWVGLNRKDKDPPPQSFRLSTTFPSKDFSEEDMDKPLNILGLASFSVLVVTDI